MHFHYLYVLAISLLISRATAGAGAEVYGCVNYPNEPQEPFTVHFIAGGTSDHCLNQKGHDATVQVTKAGMTCVSVGQVERKASTDWGDTCATDYSKWTLSYEALGTSKSGSTLLNIQRSGSWNSYGNIFDYSPDTRLCGSKVACSTTELYWEYWGWGPIYLLLDSDSYDCNEYSSSIRNTIEAAAFRGRLILVRLLLKIYSQKAAGLAFSAAVAWGFSQALDLLLNYGRRKFKLVAAIKRDTKIVQVLSEHIHGASLQEEFLRRTLRQSVTEPQWYTSLLEVQELMDLSSEWARVRLLLWNDLGRISENSTEFFEAYQDAFAEATTCGNLEMARALLAKGDEQWSLHVPESSIPDIDMLDGNGNSPLYYACANGYFKLFDFLVDGGAEIFTNHIPVRIPESGTASIEQRRVNRLQVALDSMFASEYWGRTWFNISLINVDVDYGDIARLTLASFYRQHAIAGLLLQNEARELSETSSSAEDFTRKVRRDAHQD
ncbi:hypothetical protein BJY01DRAFT_244675 [Aspergillus pseudoustus]|uniref:Ankyrin repeat-containing domain protein n=1 Tax=Aspergillus pseudoustus TaxID=1810923 RepID=A0ABR4KJT8_9EURO